MHIQIETNKTRRHDLEGLLTSLDYSAFDSLNDAENCNHMIIDTVGKLFYYYRNGSYTIKEDQLETLLLLVSMGMEESEFIKALED